MNEVRVASDVVVVVIVEVKVLIGVDNPPPDILTFGRV